MKNVPVNTKKKKKTPHKTLYCWLFKAIAKRNRLPLTKSKLNASLYFGITCTTLSLNCFGLGCKICDDAPEHSLMGLSPLLLSKG